MQANRASPLACSRRNTGIRRLQSINDFINVSKVSSRWLHVPQVSILEWTKPLQFLFVRLAFLSLVYIGVGVAAGIILILIVLVVAYFVMKSKK